MSLSVLPLYNAMLKQFTAGADSQRFNDDFIASLNDVLDELIVAGNVTPTDLPHVQSTSSTITNLQSYDSLTVKNGLRYHLMIYGQVPVAGGEFALINSQRRWEASKGEFMITLSNADQAVLDDNDLPENDIIGLGVKTHVATARDDLNDTDEDDD